MANGRRGVTYGDMRLVAAATAAMGIIRIGLWVLPFRLVHGAATRLARPSRSFATTTPAVERVVWAVVVGSRFVPHATCLTQALTAHVLLRRRGRPAELRLGVAPNGGGLEAHAWVESGGRVIIGDADVRRYAPIDM